MASDSNRKRLLTLSYILLSGGILSVVLISSFFKKGYPLIDGVLFGACPQLLLAASAASLSCPPKKNFVVWLLFICWYMIVILLIALILIFGACCWGLDGL